MWIALALLAVLLCLGGAAVYLLHVPRRPVSVVEGTVAHRRLMVEEVTRDYDSYVPTDLVPDAPLVIALHGLRQTPASLRELVGEALERQARLCGFTVVYPAAIGTGWQSDVYGVADGAFIQALIAAVAAEHACDTERVFVLGYCSGGQLAAHLALTMPRHLAGVAVVAASLPSTGVPAPSGGSVPIMIVNGTADRWVPFKGGEIGRFGDGLRGPVRSSKATAEYFAKLAGARLEQDEAQADHLLPRLAPMRSTWSVGQEPAVVLYAVKGGGHVLHQPYARQARWLGAMNPGFDVAAEACAFWRL